MGPALPVENKSSSRTPDRPLHMLTGRSECARSAAMPKTKTPRLEDSSLGRRGSTSREILNKEEYVNVSNEQQLQTKLALERDGRKMTMTDCCAAL